MRVKLLEHQIEPLYLVKLKPRSILAGDCLSSEHGAREPHEVRSYRKCTIPWNTHTHTTGGTLTNLRCFVRPMFGTTVFAPGTVAHESPISMNYLTGNLYRFGGERKLS